MAIVYITPDDFKNSCYGGFDLRAALNGFFENESNAAEMFIELVTDSLMARIDTETFRNFRWDRLTPFQMEYWKKALIAQTQYAYREGPKAVGLSSGSDDEKGKIFDPSYLRQLQICGACKDLLVRAGLYNLNIKNRRRSWPSGSNYGYF